MEMVHERAAAVQRAIKSWSRLSESERAKLDEKRRQIKLLLGREFGSEVRREGEVIGTVKAQVSPEKVLQHVLSRTRRQQDEIPFAIDAEGKVHTANPADLASLETLPLKEAALAGGKLKTHSPAMSNWIVVTRKDPESGLSLASRGPFARHLKRSDIRPFEISAMARGLSGWRCWEFFRCPVGSLATSRC
jgi:hypothetical protein